MCRGEGRVVVAVKRNGGGGGWGHWLWGVQSVGKS